MERILQFGTGRFLRGFVGAFVQDGNDATAAGGPGPVRVIDVVESTGSGTAARLAAQGGRYRLLVRGLTGGRSVDTVRVVGNIDRTLDVRADPAGTWAAGLDPQLGILVSNTTEAGYRPGADGFPGRLLELLVHRARAGMPGITILPCELIERNGAVLRRLVREEAAGRPLEPGVVEHVLDANHWAVTLVDRIVTLPPPDLPAAAGDRLAVAAEPYAAWIIEPLDPTAADLLVPPHPAIRTVPSAGPYALRKIRILNGAHTALVARTRGGPCDLVREAMADHAIATWLELMLREEVVPALGERIEEGQAFVTDVLERFRNPYLDHRLADIAVGHHEKLATRLVPTFDDHVARFSRPPSLLGRLLEQEGVR
ncbi:MAG: altronate dehydrogenase [Candidatus Limnocylindrales bacterium]